MTLFIKEHFPLVVLNLLQLFFLYLIYWLAGNEHPVIALYAVGLGVFLLVLYLVGKYINNRVLYRRLLTPDENIENTINLTTHTALGHAVRDLLKHQYRLYLSKLEAVLHRQQDYYRFVNQWIHQMKTPIAVIELIVQNDDDPRFREIQAELDRLSKGLEMALYFARLEDFKQDFRAENVRLAEIAGRVVQENKRYFIRHQVYPEVKVPDNLTALSDAKWLPFILNQLVTNAVKYSAGSGQKVIIHGYRKDARHVALEVVDYGVGIVKEDQGRVFRPFFTGENGRKTRESSGMGLYLVKEICTRLGHDIELESTVGVGTKVTLILNGTSQQR
ncbi:sensor histidine kinase [Camelliibacillus cellulosilyticus]|uniref:histidine kinase n=1 Tax=Camelliibacillus cellulosilyticus TaxID=2174486 RepID=A0ABV9GS89_9BACL